MPGYDGTGPRGEGAGGRGMGRRNRCGQGIGAGNAQNTVSGSQGYVYEYTMEELIERKTALEKEIIWIGERIKEFKLESSD